MRNSGGGLLRLAAASSFVLLAACGSLKAPPMEPAYGVTPGTTTIPLEEVTEPAPKAAEVLESELPPRRSKHLSRKIWARAPVDYAGAPEAEARNSGIGEALVRGGYGMVKGAVMGATYFVAAPPLGPLWLIFTVPAGAAVGLVGAFGSPDFEAVSAWPIMPTEAELKTMKALWPHDSEPKRVVIVNNPPPPSHEWHKRKHHKHRLAPGFKKKK